MSGPVPTFKLESADNTNIKLEDAMPESPTALSDAYMDDGDIDDPALSFDGVNQQLWMSKLPKYLWETLAKIGDPKFIDEALANIPDNQEIDLGTIRIEGDFDKPDRVSLKLNDVSFFKNIEKEYILKMQTGNARRGKQPGQVFMFSEKNKDGYKQRANVWDNLDEDGNPTMRSQLFMEVIRDEKKRENKGKYRPRARRPIPKVTALMGTVTNEFETVPVENQEHKKLELQRTSELLKPKEVEETEIATLDSRLLYGSILSTAERQSINRVSSQLYCILRELTAYSKRKLRGKWLKTAARLVSRNPCSLTCCLNNFVGTNTGVYEIYAMFFLSQNNGSKKYWRKSQSCIELETSMENGNSEMILSLMLHC